ncbi:MAG: glycosyltransferase family 4 protein [Alphaproteobacteria bacterium]|nr:glycosyltransferase family 4 protein [Alphaproteobacteria bacterium]
MSEETETRSNRHKVLVVSHYYSEHGGGIELVAGKLIDEIATSDNFSFTWAASDCDAHEESEGQRPMPMVSANFLESTIGIPWPIWGIGSLIKLKKAISEADAVWLHDTLYLGNILAFHWAKKLNKPIVITQHIDPIPYRNPILRYAMKLADRWITCKMLKEATQATFISDRVAESYYQRIAFTKPIQIIPNGVDTRQYHPPILEKRAWLRQQFALRSGQPVLLFVGRLVEKKGLATIRELAALLPDWRFWIAGRGPINPQRWHMPNVHVFDNRRDAALCELYQAADILILPSYGEGFPLVIQEALASGLPVMCSPETAAGSRMATPHVIQAEVWPNSPERTAQFWAGLLRGMAAQLPLKQPDQALADFASSSWRWSMIARAYADIFRTLSQRQ